MKEFLYSLANDNKHGFFVLKTFLWILSYVYGAGVAIIKFLYFIGVLKKSRLERPVISVGNITWGGVGKTPLVETIVKRLLEAGIKPVILTRGYISKRGRTQKAGMPLEISDEVKMLKDSLGDVPILVGSNRWQVAHDYLKQGNPADVFIMDDGFQHWKVHRDLDIVAIDCSNPFGNKKLIPRGILREPIRSIKRGDVIVLTRVSQATEKKEQLIVFLNKMFPQKAVVQADHQPSSCVDFFTREEKDLSSIQNEKICCFCAIGNPDSFRMSLEGLGAQVEKSFFFMDHHIYNNMELNNIITYCINNNIHTILITSKDAVKLENLNLKIPKSIKIYILKIDFCIVKGKDYFFERICSLSCH